MVLPVGGFFPIPLAMMIPFMATQSLVMGEAFGKAFQFGKRKISSMSNDDFNKLKIEDVASEMFTSYKNIEGKLKESISQSADFQNFIFAQLILLGPNLIKALAGSVLQPQDVPEGAGTVKPELGEGAAGVFKETPDVDLFDVNRENIPLDSSVSVADWSKHNVFRNVWISTPGHMTIGSSEQREEVRRWFYASFPSDLVKYLVVQKITIIKGGTNASPNVLTNYYRVVFYID